MVFGTKQIACGPRLIRHNPSLGYPAPSGLRAATGQIPQSTHDPRGADRSYPLLMGLLILSAVISKQSRFLGIRRQVIVVHRKEGSRLGPGPEEHSPPSQPPSCAVSRCIRRKRRVLVVAVLFHLLSAETGHRLHPVSHPALLDIGSDLARAAFAPLPDLEAKGVEIDKVVGIPTWLRDNDLRPAICVVWLVPELPVASRQGSGASGCPAAGWASPKASSRAVTILEVS